MIFDENDSEATLASFIQWAERQPDVRAAILTSTRAIPGRTVDVFSDFDIILVVTDILPYHERRAWLETLGPLLTLYHDPLHVEEGFQKSAYVVQYENGLKIDFTLCPTGWLRKIAAEPCLPDEMDAGYRLLLDKDGLAEDIQPPSYKAYIPTPPSEAEYVKTIEAFFLDAAYVAKYLWRDDVVAAKYILDHFMKHEHLLPMLEWRVEIDHQWGLKPGPYGRGLKKRLRGDLWADLENTYTGTGLGESWAALDATIALMRKTAMEVGNGLGFAYPHELDRRVQAYLQTIQHHAH